MYLLFAVAVVTWLDHQRVITLEALHQVLKALLATQARSALWSFFHCNGEVYKMSVVPNTQSVTAAVA